MLPGTIFKVDSMLACWNDGIFGGDFLVTDCLELLKFKAWDLINLDEVPNVGDEGDIELIGGGKELMLGF